MKLRARKSVVSTVTASLALVLAGPALSANASAEASSAVTGAALLRFPEFAGLTDSRALQDPLMLQGRLTDVAGKALGGAQVLMAAWPSNDVVAKLPVGGSFSVVPVARTVAGKDGSYQLRSLITPLLTSLTGRDGLDVELDVFHGGRHYVYLTQLKSDGGTTWIHDFVRGVDGQASDLRSSATNALDLAFDPAQGEKLGKGMDRGLRIPISDKPQPGGVGCTHYERIDDPDNDPIKTWTRLASAASYNGATIKTTYTKGAKTSTSTGFSFDKGVSFSINGARERSANVQAKFMDQRSKAGSAISRAYEGRIQHALLHRVCTGNKYGEYREHYITSPVEISGGFRVVDDTTRAPVGCNSKYVEKLREVSEISTENAKAYTFKNAFGFAPLGKGVFSGHALSGYTEQVKVTFFFTSKRAGWCGLTGGPLTNGQIVEGFHA